MALFENFPYTNLHNLNLNWIIQKVKSSTASVEELKESLPADVYNAVTEYFNIHPPIAVQNDSLDTLKLKHSSIPFYNVKDFNINPDSGDVYKQLHAFFKDVVYPTGGIVYFPKGKYTVSYTVFIPENTTIFGDGEDTEIYFDETDSAFGVALCNAGSNVKICNMKVSQLDTGVFHSGPQNGCIGLGDISKFQCQEPPYSHNFIRGNVRNLTAENIVFSGKYAIQCEPASGKVENVVYKNLISSGTISVQTTFNSEVNNVLVENCKCGLLRILIGTNTKNVNITNIVADGVNVYNAGQEYVKLSNIINTTTPQNNDYDEPEGKNKITGNTTFTDCYFTEDSTTVYGIKEAGGIHIFERCVFNFPSCRVWTRLANIVADDNYAIISNSILINSETGTTSVIVGYGWNNKYTGLISSWLVGDAYLHKNLGWEISATDKNSMTFNGDTVHLQITTPVSDTTVYTFPSSITIPTDCLDTRIPIYVTLYDYVTNAIKHTWAAIENNAIVIKEPDIDMTAYNRAIIDCDLRFTRKLKPTEMAGLWT